MRNFLSNMNFFQGFVYLIITTIILSLVFVGPIIAHTTQEDITLTVSEKVIKRSHNQSDKYLIFTNDGVGEVLENTDSLYVFKWNSSDLYGRVKVGETYKFKVYGFRIPFLSMYRNIISFERQHVKKKETKEEESNVKK